MSVYSTAYKLFWAGFIALVIGVLPVYAQTSNAGGLVIMHATNASIQAYADHSKGLAINKHAAVYKVGLKRRIADLFKKSVKKNPNAKKIVRLLLAQAAKALKRSRA